ncbi:hypothetical protein LVY72_18710 [Arthrobacter sp. I2-34]|uniref:CBU-0592-like domain-containing protein n=1 Tax=Arthrobacter hankyongi TaxID=2904801 RepID=A0ABS9LBN3_9MICC|nr:hypothetical protein [Arthrobacter hankyongi]MCG2623928.1 hypothetical protein [Arthrobacter hankyongi]
MAYAMVLRGWLTSASRAYAALNAAGGLMAGTACVIYGAWPSAASNLAWAALGVHSMVGMYRRRRLELRGNGSPDPASAACPPATVLGAAQAAGVPLGRAVPAQAVAEPHRSPGCMVPQLP